VIRPFYTWELMGAPVPPSLIEGLVSRYGITGLSADPGVGKTFLAIEMLRSVVTGTPFLGHFPTKRGGVLFVGQDCSILEYARQMRKTTRLDYARLQPPDDDDAGNPFDEFVRWWIHPGISLERPDHIEELIAHARRVPTPDDANEPEPYFNYETRQWEYKDHPPAAALIVLDVLSMMHGVSENANDEMLLVFKNIRRVSDETGAAIAVLHHHSYASELHGGRWRGASSQLQTLDGHLELRRGRGPAKRIWCTTKKFRGIAMPPFAYTMDATETDVTFAYLGTKEEIGADADNANDPSATPAEPAVDSLLDTVRQFAIGHDGPFTNGDTREFLVTLGLKIPMGNSLRNRVSKMLAVLEAEGLILKDGYHKYTKVTKQGDA
jgi:hypothetical protein